MLVEIRMVKAILMSSDRNEEHVIRQYIKGHLCYTASGKNLAELCLCPSVLLKVELMNNKIGFLVENISKQKC